jgi:DNA-3-methyladenine glycosylase
MVGPDPWRLRSLLSATRELPREFYARPTVEVAKSLLSCVIRHGPTTGMIVETEAYLGDGDRAAHFWRGKTPRTEVIFGPPGHAYVYFIYGMHDCFNVVTEPDGTPGAVLIRAIEPLTGLAAMSTRRHFHSGKRLSARELTNGPAKLTEALGITCAHNGCRLDRGPLVIRAWREPRQFEIGVTPRIGITHCADLPLRFVWKGNSFLSKPFPIPRVRRPHT